MAGLKGLSVLKSYQTGNSSLRSGENDEATIKILPVNFFELQGRAAGDFGLAKLSGAELGTQRR